MLLSPSCHETGVSWCFIEFWYATEGGNPGWLSPFWWLHEVGLTSLVESFFSQPGGLSAPSWLMWSCSDVLEGNPLDWTPISTGAGLRGGFSLGQSVTGTNVFFQSSARCRYLDANYCQGTHRVFRFPHKVKFLPYSWLPCGPAVPRLLLLLASLKFRPNHISWQHWELSSMYFFPANSYKF